MIKYFNHYIDINLDNKEAVKKIIRTVFILYILFVLYKLLLGNQRIFEQGMILANRHAFNNIIPFKSIMLYIKYFSYFSLANWLLNIFGNILIFIPFGVLFPVSTKTRSPFLNCLFSGFLLSGTIEVIQLVTALGIFDIDDTILNLTGVVVGYVVYKILFFMAVKIKQ